MVSDVHQLFAIVSPCCLCSHGSKYATYLPTYLPTKYARMIFKMNEKDSDMEKLLLSCDVTTYLLPKFSGMKFIPTCVSL